MELVFVSFQSFKASDGIEAIVIWYFWSFGDVISISGAGNGDDSIFGRSHEEAKVALIASSKRALIGSSIVTKVNMEFADRNGCGADVGVKWC